MPRSTEDSGRVHVQKVKLRIFANDLDSVTAYQSLHDFVQVETSKAFAGPSVLLARAPHTIAS